MGYKHNTIGENVESGCLKNKYIKQKLMRYRFESLLIIINNIFGMLLSSVYISVS